LGRQVFCPVAQLVERLAVNQVVEGSKPSRAANIITGVSVKDFERRVIDVMLYEGSIPPGVFQISEAHLNSYIDIYGSIFGTKGKGLTTKQEHLFARKLAGRTLVRHLVECGAKFSEVKAGMVYMISNPAFPKHYKIGMTLDVMDRLDQYQTYDPYRQFKIEKYSFVLDRRHNEQLILQHPDMVKENGEWVLRDRANELFLSLTRH
jgi:hypothetical protein